jgi:hypothetical protein
MEGPKRRMQRQKQHLPGMDRCRLEPGTFFTRENQPARRLGCLSIIAVYRHPKLLLLGAAVPEAIICWCKKNRSRLAGGSGFSW